MGTSQNKKTPEVSSDSKQRPKVAQAPMEVKENVDASKTTKQADKKTQDEEGTRNLDSSKSPGSTAPPPPGDAMSWPTPKLAEEGGKRKPSERGEKSEKEKTPGKAHGKEKWEKIDYVPTAVFNTPMPTARRGGRGGARGGRESSRGGHPGGLGDRTTSGGGDGMNASGSPYSDRSRGNMGPPRGGATGSRPKRSASAGPLTSRGESKEGEPTPERRNESGSRHFTPGPRYGHNDRRTSTTSTQTEFGLGLRNISPTRRHQPGGPDREGIMQPNFNDSTHLRGLLDRRNDSMGKGQDSQGEQGFVPMRERGDSRSERSRGGYRGGRGGHPNPNTHAHGVNGPNTAHQQPHGFVPTKSQSFTEQRQSQQPSAPNFGQPRDARHHRSGSRSQSIPNQPQFGRFPSNPGPAALHMPNLHTDVANMYYNQSNQPAVMSAMPYHPYMEQMQIQGMVQMQM